jgi:ABC-type phosphate/phosphonate transport system permease subunit
LAWPVPAHATSPGRSFRPFESIRGFHYAETATILIAVVITVAIVDLIPQQLGKLVI